MRRGLLLGLTGGIGTGKSTALDEFSRLGARTLSLDRLARDLVRRGRSGFLKVVRAFGPEVVGEDGELDRRELGRRVFSNPAERRRLERLLHPMILREMSRWMEEGKKSRRLSVVDAPLLFEGKLERRFDGTLLIAADKKVRLERVCRRDGLTPAQARRRLEAQMPQMAKARLADVVVANNGSEKKFKSALRAYYRAFELIQGGVKSWKP